MTSFESVNSFSTNRQDTTGTPISTSAHLYELYIIFEFEFATGGPR